MKSFFISLFIHFIVIFILGGYFQVLSKKEMKLEKREESSHIHQTATEVIPIVIRITKRDMEAIFNKEKMEKRKLVQQKEKAVKSKQPNNQKETKNSVARAKQIESKGKEELISYVKDLRSFIESKKSYPKIALRLKQSGIVEICLDIDENGLFQNIHLKEKSKFNSLNDAAIKLIKELAHFKPLPNELGKKITLNVPLNYSLSL